MLARILTAVLVLAAAGCQKKLPIVEQFEAWWETLPPAEQERVRMAPVGSDVSMYRIHLEGHEAEDSELAAFEDWVNRLTPGQIETFELHRLGEHAPDAVREIDNPATEIVRGSACSGSWAVSAHCEPWMPRVGQNKCLRCVPGMKEIKP